MINFYYNNNAFRHSHPSPIDQLIPFILSPTFLQTLFSAVSNKMIRIFSEGDAWLIWDSDSVRTLRSIHGIIGSPSLTAPHFPQQSKFLGLPLSLSACEVLWCHSRGIAELCSARFPAPPPAPAGTSAPPSRPCADRPCEYTAVPASPPPVDPLRYSVFCALKAEGYWVTDAANYGCDFAVYARAPWECHASALVWCMRGALDTKRLIALQRIAESALKRLLCASLSRGGALRLTEFRRLRCAEPRHFHCG